MAHDQETKAKLKAASVSILANSSLIVVKLAVALFTGSIAILAEALHSLFDLLASVFAYAGIRQASKPADEEHHYGHEKFENLSSLVQTLLIVLTAFFVIYESITRILDPHHTVQNVPVAAGIMLLTLVVDIGVARYLHRISGETGSAALEADAYHFSTDLWSAVAVLIGLGFVMLGFPVFDSVAAIIVAILMLFVSYTLGRKSLLVMLDISPPPDVVADMRAAIHETRDVENFHQLRVRQSGSKLFADVHLRVKGGLSVREGHALSHEVKRNLMARHPRLKDVTIHIEPANADDLRFGREKRRKKRDVLRR